MKRKTNKNNLKSQGFYQSTEWRELREFVLRRDHYLCRLKLSDQCMRIANTVHHIKALEDYPELALDADNLVSCCYWCHEVTKAKQTEIPKGVRVIRM